MDVLSRLLFVKEMTQRCTHTVFHVLFGFVLLKSEATYSGTSRLSWRDDIVYLTQSSRHYVNYTLGVQVSKETALDSTKWRGICALVKGTTPHLASMNEYSCTEALHHSLIYKRRNMVKIKPANAQTWLSSDRHSSSKEHFFETSLCWDGIFLARAAVFLTSNIWIQIFSKNSKKNQDVDNIAVYQCANFKNKIYCILGSVKIKF
jgi:hypothetical protein